MTFGVGNPHRFKEGHVAWFVAQGKPSPFKGRHQTKKSMAKISGVNHWNYGKPSPMRGVKASKSTREKLRKSHLDQKPWNKGKVGVYSLSEGTKKKMSKFWKEKLRDKKYLGKRIKASMKVANRKPNKLEKRLEQIIQRHNLPFKYVGNGKFILGGKCPDFLNVDGRKQVIEVFGDYWHTERARCFEETEEGRKQFFAKYGFGCLILWEHELNNLPEQEIVEKVETMSETREVVVRTEDVKVEAEKRPLKVAHFASWTPRQSGLYEGCRDLVVSLR